MNISVKSIDITSHKTDVHVVTVYEGGKLSPTAKMLDETAAGQIKTILKRGDINGSQGQALLLHDIANIQAKRVLLLGAGKPKSLTDMQYRQLLSSLADQLNQYKFKDVCLHLADITLKNRDSAWMAQQAAEVITHSLYRYHKTKSDKVTPPSLKKVIWAADSADVSAGNKAAKIGQAVAQGMSLTRELGNLPGNVCTPTYLANEAKKLGRQYQFKVTVLGQKQIEALKMGAFLSVAKGSREPAKFITMEYQGKAKSEPPIVLVGKGITFDSGGISIKPGAAMDEMKFDMCGAATVFGVMRTLGQLKPNINVVAIVPTCENLPDGIASKPGDVVTSMSGQTIEVLNTDAEGRLILCDALTFAEKYKPKAVIDIATLTGACLVALGKQTAGLLGNDQPLVDKILDAGQQSLDRAWQLPLWDEYQEQLKSNFADMANIGGRDAGTITAACFLSRYTKKYKWAHLDIAGVAWHSGANKGATGRPVPLLTQFLLNEVK